MPAALSRIHMPALYTPPAITGVSVVSYVVSPRRSVSATASPEESTSASAAFVSTGAPFAAST